MATRQQRIKLERARQQQAAAARQQQPSRPLGAEAIDAIERDLATFSQLPGVRQGLQFVGGTVKVVNEAVLDPLRYASEEQLAGREADPGAALLGHVVRGFEYGVQKGEEGGAIIAERWNVDPRIGSFLGGTAAETLLTAGAGTVAKKAVKAVDVLTPPTGMVPALAGAAPMPTPMRLQADKGGIVLKATTSPGWTAPGMGQDVAQTSKYAPAVKRFEARESAWQEVIDTLKKSYETGNISEAKLKSKISEIQSIRKGDLSTFDYDPENLYSFFEGLKESPYAKQTRRRGELKELEAARTQDPYDPLFKAHQHHILAKAETKPFVETLLRLMNEGVADKDDLVNFFVWPEKYDLFPGNVRKNLLDMGAITHTTAKQDPMALHNLLKEAGLEYGSRTNPEMIKRYGLDRVTSADELMQAYDLYLQEIAIPSRDIAYKAQDWWYNKTTKTLKGKELAEFKANFAKLRDPRRNP
jgi:hypothetical protein